MVVRSSPRDFERMVSGNMIKKFPITIAGIRNANKKIGPGIGSLRRKTVWHKPETVVSDYISIPPEILDKNSNLDITTDLVFVNNIPVLVTLGQQVKYTTIENLPNRWEMTLLKGIRLVISLYNKQKYSISTMFMKNGYEVLEAEINKIRVTLNTTAAIVYIPETERQICVIKERVWAVWNTLPYTRLPSCMISKMIYYSVLWVNGLPVGIDVYYTLSTHIIMTGTTVDCNKHCKIEFGAYSETHESPTTTKPM